MSQHRQTATDLNSFEPLQDLYVERVLGRALAIAIGIALGLLVVAWSVA